MHRNYGTSADGPPTGVRAGSVGALVRAGADLGAGPPLRIGESRLQAIGCEPTSARSLGRTVANALPDAAAQGYVELLDRVFTTGEPYAAVGAKYEMQIAPGDAIVERYVDFVYQPLKDAEDRVTGVFVLGADVTERTLAERAVLEREMQLRETDRRKDEFLAMLAHELRNPLAPIRAGLELIRLAGSTPDAVERTRAMMDRQVGHMVRLIDDLLDVSRITTGKIQLRRTPTLLTAIIGNAVDVMREAMHKKHIQLTVDVPDVPYVLDVDPTRVVQILSNLLHNATKFTEQGGTIGVRARRDQERHVVTVRDSGRGIAPELLPRVFDLFVQGRETSQPGLGIGLALARQLIGMHGGTITARSPVSEHGSEFEVVLPLSCTNMPSTEPLHPGPRVARRVLVIDDNQDAADVTAQLVETLGGVARVAYDGNSGLAVLRDFCPDIVLLDIRMRPIDGYETCRRIREVGRTIVIIAVTGWGQAHDKQKAFDAGFDAHLTKPVDPAALARLLADQRLRSVVPD